MGWFDVTSEGVSAPGADVGGGFLAGLKNAFSNPMLLQMLATGGAALATGKPELLAGAVNQNLASQSYLKVLRRMLGGEIPEGGKITHDDTGTKIVIPRISSGTPGALGGGTQPQTSSIWGDQTGGIPYDMPIGGVNPFASANLGGLKAADLVGLTPENMTAAVQLKQNQDTLYQRMLADAADNAYKSGLLRHYGRQEDLEEARIANETRARDVADENLAREWYATLTKDDRTELEKNYEAAVKQGFQGKIWDFKTLSDDPETIKLYEAAVKDGSFDKKKGLWGFIKERLVLGRNTINISRDKTDPRRINWNPG